MIQIVKFKPKLDAPRDANPDNALAMGHAAFTPAPPGLFRAPELANRRKFSLDGKSLTMRGRGHLVDLFCHNLNASTRYLHLFNSDSPPQDGATPDRLWSIATATALEKSWSNGLCFETGITLILSSSQAALTAVTAADGRIDATFIMA